MAEESNMMLGDGKSVSRKDAVVHHSNSQAISSITNKFDATHIDNESKTKYFPFIQLPKEIRLAIYDIYFKADGEGVHFCSWRHKMDFDFDPPVFQFNLLRICRQVYEEAHAVKRTVGVWMHIDSALTFLLYGISAHPLYRSVGRVMGRKYFKLKGCQAHSLIEARLRQSITKLNLNLSVCKRYDTTLREGQRKPWGTEEYNTMAKEISVCFPALKEIQISILRLSSTTTYPWVTFDLERCEPGEFKTLLEGLLLAIPKDIKVTFDHRYIEEYKIEVLSRERLEKLMGSSSSLLNKRELLE